MRDVGERDGSLVARRAWFDSLLLGLYVSIAMCLIAISMRWENLRRQCEAGGGGGYQAAILQQCMSVDREDERVC